MAHQFTIKTRISNIPLSTFRQLVRDPSLHEDVCNRIPGDNIQILESKIEQDTYTLARAYNLDVNIPDIAKKFLKDAFRLQRTDVSDLEQLTSTVTLAPNLPLQANCQRTVIGDETGIEIQLNWDVKVKVPLIGGMLEKHAEGEIRKFSQLEIEIVEDELKKRL